MSTANRLVTADELLHWPNDGLFRELVEGEVITMSPSGFWHSRCGAVIAELIGAYVRKNKLGMVTGSDGGFVLAKNPDTMLSPDCGFISNAQLNRIVDRDLFFPGPPDLAVEVKSPGDSSNEVADKVELWLKHGVQQVWVARPEVRTITVHFPSESPVTYGMSDAVPGGSLLPGFALAVTDVFET